MMMAFVSAYVVFLLSFYVVGFHNRSGMVWTGITTSFTIAGLSWLVGSTGKKTFYEVGGFRFFLRIIDLVLLPLPFVASMDCLVMPVSLIRRRSTG